MNELAITPLDNSTLRPAPTWLKLTAAMIRWLPDGQYRAMRWVSRCVRGPFLATMPSELGGGAYRCDLRDGVTMDAFFQLRYEPHETAIVLDVLRPGDTFIDVGANWGYFTIIASHRVGPRGRVLSFEPDPRLHAVLDANVRGNGFSQTRVLPIAASDREATLSLAGFDEKLNNFGVSRLASDNAAAERMYSVQSRRLDDVLDEQGIPSVAILKMDIEGAEGMALRGLERSLASRRVQRLLLEVHPGLLEEHGDSPASVMKHLADIGYTGWTIPSDVTQGGQPTRLIALDPSAPLGLWPHQLWTAPGVAAPFA